MISFRSHVEQNDLAAVRRMVKATKFFSEEEATIAEELVAASEQGADKSGYHFIFADRQGPERHGPTPVGFACFGPIPGSKISFDLYWIVVDPKEQGAGLGRELLKRVEKAVQAAAGMKLYADTSSRAQYLPTRKFYENCGYSVVASLENFYDDGDGKIIYAKRLTPTAMG